MNAPRRFFSSLLLPALVSAPAAADVVLYDGGFDLWKTAVPTYNTCDFIGMAVNEVVTTQYSSIGATFTNFGGSDIVRPFSLNIYPQDGFGIDGNAAVEILFSSPMHAVSAHGPGYFRFQLFSGNTMFHQTDMVGGQGVNHFGGVTSTQSFDRIRLVSWDFDTVNFDNIYFSTIPAPAASALFAIALCRKRRSRWPATASTR